MLMSTPNPPALEDLEPRNSPNVRDQFLKSGYEKPTQSNTDKEDKDLDNKILSGDLGSVFGSGLEKEITPYDKKTSENFHYGTMTPYERQTPQNFFYGKSQTMKTVVNPDGSTETHSNVRDNDGNEEMSVCRRIGDKEYCIVRKRDKSGKEEVTEHFVNMDESEKDIFSKPSGSNLITEEPSGSRFPFDKFFK
nr:uncharacterized protein LOC111517134 [Leptinotarsa decemlineata]